MAAQPSWHVWCDFCGEQMGADDDSMDSAAEARIVAKMHGGHRSKGKDVCDVCWDEGKR